MCVPSVCVNVSLYISYGSEIFISSGIAHCEVRIHTHKIKWNKWCRAWKWIRRKHHIRTPIGIKTGMKCDAKLCTLWTQDGLKYIFTCAGMKCNRTYVICGFIWIVPFLCLHVFQSVYQLHNYYHGDIKTELNWMSVCPLNKSTRFKFIILICARSTRARVWPPVCVCVSVHALFIQHNIVFALNSNRNAYANHVLHRCARFYSHIFRIMKSAWLVRSDSLLNLFTLHARQPNCLYASLCVFFL